MKKRKLYCPRLHGKGVVKGNVAVGALGAGLILSFLLAGLPALAALELGSAANFAVFQMGFPAEAGGAGGSFQSSDVRINGDVGFRGSTQNNSNTRVTGRVFGPGPTAPGWTISGGYFPTPDSDLQAIAQQARDFSAAAIDLGGTISAPTLGTVTGGTYTFTAANLALSGTYILNVGTINVNNSPWTLDGSMLPAGSRVIVNVTGSYTQNANGGNIFAGPNLSSSQILMNYVGTGGARIQGGADLYGTFLGPNSTLTMNHQQTFVDGSVIVQSVSFASNPSVNGVSFIPEPSTYIAGALLLLPLGASARRILRKRKK